MHRMLIGLLFLGTFAPMVGCEDNEASLYIIQAKPLDPENCFALEDEAVGLTRGVVDLALASNYVLFLEAQNNMPDVRAIKTFTVEDYRLNTQHVSLSRAVVSYNTQEEIQVNFPQEVRVPLSGTVFSDEGRIILGVEVLSSTLVQELRQSPQFLTFGQDTVRPARSSIQLIVNVELQGRMLDGKSITSNTFRFPLRVCNGCLVSYSLDAVSPEAPAPNCLNLNQDATGSSGVEAPRCLSFLGQDEAIDCRVCKLFAVDPFARQLCEPPQ